MSRDARRREPPSRRRAIAGVDARDGARGEALEARATRREGRISSD